jgi:hypothetical protein
VRGSEAREEFLVSEGADLNGGRRCTVMWVFPQMFGSYECCVLTDRGLCDGPITRLEE